MFTYPFEILKKRLTDNVPEKRELDWYMNQDDPKDENAALKASPAIYIQFFPVNTKDLGYGIQQAETEFEIILLTSNVYDTGSKRMKKDQPQDHMRVFDKIFKTLSGFSARLSYLPDFSSLLNTPNDQRVMNTISRISMQPPAARKSMMRSVQRFKCVVWDHAAFKTYTKQSPQPPLEVTNELS